MASPETFEVITTSSETNGLSDSPEMVEKASVSEGNFDKGSLEKDLINGVKRSGKGIKSVLGKDWWWRQGNGVVERGKVKDYVMDWISTEIKKERPNSDWIAASSSCVTSGKLDKKKSKKRLEWWVSLDEEKEQNVKKIKKEKRKLVREWWREEYCEEFARKNNNNKKNKQESGMYSDDNGVDDWWPRDEESYVEKKKKKKKKRMSRSSRGSVDWWLDGLSGEL